MIPGMKPGQEPTHNNSLRVLVWLLNLGGILLLAQLAHTLNWSDIVQYAILAVGQAGGSHLLYRSAIAGKSDTEAPAGAAFAISAPAPSPSPSLPDPQPPMGPPPGGVSLLPPASEMPTQFPVAADDATDQAA
jgi:hypothetical protein